MSREQQTEQTQSNATEAYAERDGDIQGLPPHLFGLVMKVKPGDAAALVALLRQHPPYAERILAAASPHAGLSTVKQAQAMMPQEAVGAGGSLGSIKPGSEYDLESSPAVVPQIKYDTNEAEHTEELLGMDGGRSQFLPEDVRQRVGAIRTGDSKALGSLFAQYPELFDTLVMYARSLHGVDTVSTAIDVYNDLRKNPEASTGNDQGQTNAGGAGQATAKQDDKWESGARAYNASHTQWVSKFLDIMKDPSLVGADGQVDPHKVAAFQRAQGLDADGRVGPQTVAAAQKYADTHPNFFGFD
jgi:hypothetical protein